MAIIPNEITRKFAQDKYLMSTGSDPWQDIKGTYEMLDDAIAGTVMRDNQNSIDISEIKNLTLDIERFRTRILNYNSRDRAEAREKKILQNKIDTGLEMCKIILNTIG